MSSVQSEPQSWRHDPALSEGHRRYRESLLALPPLTGPYVYVIRSAGDIYKIGCAYQNVKARLRRLRFNPAGEEVTEVVRLYPVFDARLAETCAHALVAHRRVSGEWFFLEEREFRRLDAVLSRLKP